ncbi:hypothetical protein [Streptomyces goshikiensis]|uniref:hypothetical protein n=1 Tax=Streptomyces goshikiensis TaxID=1942 RepID=UPI0036877F30
MIDKSEGLAVFRTVRGLAGGAALIVALAACGSNGDDGASAVGGAGAAGGKSKAAVVVTEDMIRTALISKTAAPKGWRTVGGVQIREGGDSLRECEAQTQTNCGGFVSVGSTTLFLEEGATVSESSIRYSIVSFRSVDDAKAGLKGMAAEARRKAGADAKPLKVSAGADETDAFTGPHTEVMMRVGSALVRLESGNLTESQPQPYGDFAKLQIDRLHKTAEGKNPDA